MYTVYRSLSNHVSYFMLLAFIMMTDVGMPDRWSGVLIIFASLMSLLASKYAYLVGDKKWRWRTWVFASSMQGILLICIGFLTQQWIRLVLIYLFFELFEWLRMPAWNHCIVQETKWVAIATTRSLIFAVFGLWTTVGKQFLSFFPIAYAMIGIGIFILLVNLYFARKIVNASSTFD